MSRRASAGAPANTRPIDQAPDRYSGMRPWAPGLYLSALVLLGSAAYSNALSAPFLFDDVEHVRHPLGRFPTAVSWIWPRPRLVGDWTLAANEAFGGSDPVGFHLVNVLIHLAVGCLLFLLVRRTLRSPRLADVSLPGDATAFACAAVWLVHPLTTAAATYVIQRSESLMALFFLFYLYALARSEPALDERSPTTSTAIERSPGWQPFAWLIAAAAAFYLGLHSKAVMAAAFPVGVLYDRIFLSRSWSDLGKKRGGLYGAMLLLFLLAAGWLGRTILGEPGKNVGFFESSVSPLAYALSQPSVILHYLRLALAPWPLCFDYGWPVADSAAAAAPACLAVLGLLALTAWAVWKHPAWGFLGAAFFLILAPTSSIVPIKDLAFEQRMYLPLAAVVCLVVLATQSLLARLLKDSLNARLLPGLVLGAVLVGLTLLTYTRNEDYQSSIAIWAATARTAPTNDRAWYNLALALEKEGRDSEALIAAQKWLLHAEANHQPIAECHLMLGELLTRQAKWKAAAEQFQLAINAFEQTPPIDKLQLGTAHISFGTLLELQAQSVLQAAQQSRQIDAPALESFLKQQMAAAEQHYRQGIAWRPEDTVAYALLAQNLSLQQKPKEAVEQYRQALERDPNSADLHRGLARLYLQLNDPEQAAKHEALAQRFEP